ncbi:MAG: CopD family protein [Candidatus Hodarchaeales archaeon]
MPAELLPTIIGWIHNIAVIIWIGGAFYFEFILRPNLLGVVPDEAKKLNQGVARRFMPLAWVSVVIIAVTGILRLFGAGAGELFWFLNAGSYSITLYLKLGIFVVMIVLGGLVGFLAQKLPKATSREEAMTIQRNMKIIMRVNILLGVIVVLLSVGLRLGGF